VRAAVAIAATLILREEKPLRQALALNFLGLLLSLWFFASQAPDVAMAEITVGAAAQPLVFLAILTRLHRKPGHPEDARAAGNVRGADEARAAGGDARKEAGRG
jgi:uncharacterized MnhB-related membrane protein